MRALVVGATTTLSPACRHEDISPLQAIIKRGQSRLIPHTHGRRRKPMRQDELECPITWFINGRLDPSGNPYGDRATGLETNVEFYRALLQDGGDVDGAKAATLHTGIEVLETLIQVPRWEPVTTGPFTKTVLTLIRVSDPWEPA